MDEKMTIEQFGVTIKQKYPAYSSYSDAEVGQKMIVKYPQYKDKIKVRYTVPKPVETKEQKLTKATSEAEQAKKESVKANSFGGVLGNMIKDPNLGNLPFVGGAVKTANILNKAIDNPANKNQEKYTEQLRTRNIQLQKIIKEKESKKVDSTRDKTEWNNNQDQIDKHDQEVKKYTEELPTNKQALGAVGQTGLDMLTVGTYGKSTKGMSSAKLGKASPSAVPKDPKFFTKKTLVDSGVGAGVGGAYGATSSIAEGDETKDVIKNTLIGTAFGAAVPLVLKAPGAIKNDITKNPATGTSPRMDRHNEKLVKKVEKEIFKIENNYANTRKANKFSKDAGAASRNRIAKANLLTDSVDEGGLIRTKQPGGPIDKYKAATVDQTEGTVRQNLERLGETVEVSTIEKQLLKEVRSSGLEGDDLKTALDKIAREVEGYKLRADPQGRIPLVIVHDAKISTTKQINYQTPPEKATYRKAVARGLKRIVEKNSVFNVEETNKELTKHYEDIALLERLDGKKVKGGKLGKYFAQISGNIIGGVAGGAVGGPLGSAAGTIIGGEAGGRIQGAAMQRTFKGGKGGVIEQSEVLKKASELGKSKRNLPALIPGNDYTPASGGQKYAPIPMGGTLPSNEQSMIDASYSRRLGNMNIKYNKTKTITTTGISKSIPQSLEKVKNDLLTSGHDLDSMISSGDIDKSKVFRQDGTLQPQQLEHVVNDLSGKIDDYSKGLGKEFKKSVNLDNPTPENLIDQARAFLTKAAKKIKETPNQQGGFVKLFGPNSDKKVIEKKANIFLKKWFDIAGDVESGGGKDIKLKTKDFEEIAEYFKDTKPTKPITLYRGIEKGQQEGLLKRPSSWTYSREVAKEHTYGNGKVIKIKVDPDQVLVDLGALDSKRAQKLGIIDEEEEVILKPLKAIIKK